jgi:hypothetical protein
VFTQTWSELSGDSEALGEATREMGGFGLTYFLYAFDPVWSDCDRQVWGRATAHSRTSIGDSWISQEVEQAQKAGLRRDPVRSYKALLSGWSKVAANASNLKGKANA